jgi:hypothetical protein
VKSVSALSAGAYTTTLLVMVMSPPLLLFTSKIFRHGNNLHTVASEFQNRRY